MTTTKALEVPRGIPSQWYGKQYVYHWSYTDKEGDLLGYAVRYESSTDEKEVIPFFKCNGTQRKSGYAEGPRPLFGLEVIADTNSNATVYVAEGEKAAQAAHQLGLPCVTSPGGSNAAHEADWEPLARFQSVVILPDNDDPGRKYAADVTRILEDLPGERTIRIAPLSGLPEKGDLVDWIQDRVPEWDGYGQIPREPGDDLTVELLAEIETVADVAVSVAGSETHSDRMFIGDSEFVANVAMSQGGATEKTSVLPEEPEELIYPLDSLGKLLSGAIRAVQECVQAPYALCAQSVLAAATHAVQAHANLIVDGRRISLSEFYITIAQSGERKSAVDKVVLHEHYRRQSILQEKAAGEWAKYKAKLDLYKEARKCILRDAGDQGSTVPKLVQLEEPQSPLQPILIPDDITLEGLQKLLLSGQPSMIVANDEAGTLIGGHAFNPDNILKSLAGFSKFWDGTPIARVRGGDGASILEGKRVTLHLQMQPIVSRQLLGNAYTQGQGFLSRCLIACPQSTAGTRFYREVDLFADPRLVQFHEALRTSLERPPNLRSGTPNVLDPRTIALSDGAKQLYIEYYDHIEGQLGQAGEYESVRGFANKAPEHALRLAGVITLLGDLEAEDVAEDAIRGGIGLADYYLQSLLRVEQLPQVDLEQVQANQILNWMEEKDPQRLREWKTRDIQNAGPGSVRNLGAEAIRNRMAILVDTGHVEPSGSGNKTTWRLL